MAAAQKIGIFKNSASNFQESTKTRKKRLEKSGQLPIIGIVGAVGAGKSTVAAAFERLGCGVIRADELNHEVLNRPAVLSQLKLWWGVNVIGMDGKVDRAAVSDIVFNNEKELKRLTDLVHPLIFQRQEEMISAFESESKVKAIILDIPLLLEIGQEVICDTLVYVRAEERLRIERLGRSRGWTREKIKKIENFQIGLDNKAKISEYTVENNSNIPETAKQVSRVLSLILEKATR